MKAGNRRDEAETETIARAVSAALKPIKPSQNLLALLCRDSRPVIGYRKQEAVCAVRERHRNLPSAAAVLDRVIDEIRNRVEQQIPIANYGYRLAFGEPEADGVLLRRRIEQLYDLASYLGDVNIAERSLSGHASRSEQSAEARKISAVLHPIA